MNVSLQNLIVSMETDGIDLPIVQLDDYRFESGSTYLITGAWRIRQQTAIGSSQTESRSGADRTNGADTDEKRAFVAELEKTGGDG